MRTEHIAVGGSVRASMSAFGLLLALVAASFVVPLPAMGQSEEGVKAAFLFNFAKFTEWPATAFQNNQSAVTVGFVGADALAASFEKNVAGKNANGRDLVVRRLQSPDGADACHIVFFGDGSMIQQVLALVKGKPILTVGEGDSFLGLGGMVRFIKDGARVSFDLDLDSAAAASLRLDPKVQQIARNVKGR